jgi:hypothetical protein
MPRKIQEVANRKDGFNEVDAWITPSGELVISLSHRTTSDEQVLVRVRDDSDVILTDEILHDNPDAWEDDNQQLGRLNHGGNWGNHG